MLYVGQSSDGGCCVCFLIGKILISCAHRWKIVELRGCIMCKIGRGRSFWYWCM